MLRENHEGRLVLVIIMSNLDQNLMVSRSHIYLWKHHHFA